MSHRVAVREIREYTWRALVVAGFSAGEATVAAEAVALSEIHFGCGLDVVAEHVASGRPPQRSPARLEPEGHLQPRGPGEAARLRAPGEAARLRAPGEAARLRAPGEAARLRAPGEAARLRDDAGQGLLRLAPLAIGLLVADRADDGSVDLPDCSWHAILGGFLLAEVDQPHGRGLTLAAIGTAPDGEDLLIGVGRDGLLYRPDRLSASLGVRIARLETEESDRPPPQLVSFASLAEQRRSVERNGIEIPESRWHPVAKAAQGYLVAD